MNSKLTAPCMFAVALGLSAAVVSLLTGCQPSRPLARGKSSNVTSGTSKKAVQPAPQAKAKPKPAPENTSRTADQPTAKAAPTKEPVTVAAEDKPPAKLDMSAWKAQPGDYPQWLGSGVRNNVFDAKNIPAEWNVGGFDRKTGAWKKDKAQNIKWFAALGSQTYGNPVVAAGKVFVGTNNGNGYIKRYPYKVDLGCLVCFNEADGRFLWQHSSEKLITGLIHDWPLMGICCAPYVEGDRLWFVTSRGEVRCLDAEGFYDDEDDGPVQHEWVKQFAAEPLMQAGLNDNLISDSLAAQFEKAGAKIPSGPTVETIEEDQKWIISFRQGADETELQVRVEGTNLTGARIAKEGDKSEVMDLFTADTRLMAGLEEGKLSDALRTHFNLSGISLPADAAAKAETPGKLWTIAASVAGADRQFRLKMAGPRLVCEKLLTTGDKDEADVVWVLDMMTQLQVSQHNMCSCSITALGDILFVCTSNGVDETHLNVPAPNAPSFMALDKHTGKVLWTDKSPGANIHHGQWSSPAVGTLGDVPQVVFAGGDGWLYSFRADAGKDGQPEFLWKFDTNPKDTKLVLGHRGTRNDIIATPVIYDGRVYVATGQDPEHQEGPGRLWCIDPTKRGDVSKWLAVKRDDPNTPLPYRRVQAVMAEEGEIAVPNPNSAALWEYAELDENGDGKIVHEEAMHRSCGSVAIKDDILFIADFSGLVHCFDAKSGKQHWTYDMLAPSWGSPLIADGKVFIGDEDGDVTVFEVKREKHKPIAEISMQNSVYSTPIVANGVLYIANKSHLFAIEAPADK